MLECYDYWLDRHGVYIVQNENLYENRDINRRTAV
jgi:hypothetical protein